MNKSINQTVQSLFIVFGRVDLFFVLCKDNIERATEQYMHSKQNNKKSDALLIILLKRRTKSLLFYFQRKQKQKQKGGWMSFLYCLFYSGDKWQL